MEYIDYRELHRDTINKLHQMVNSGKITVETACGICADFVPESEDERIRKIIKQSLKSYFEGKLSIGTNDVDYAICLSWLKKQGEKKPADNVIEDEEKHLLDKFKQAVYDCAWGKVTCKKEGETKEEYANRWAEQFLLIVRDWADDYIDFTIQQKLRNSYEKGKADMIEKLHEQKPTIEMKTSEESLGIDSDTYNKIVDECIYGEQKPTDKVEPKFREGDWVVLSTSDGEKVVQVDFIEYFKSGEPIYVTSEGRWFDNRTKAHLWTIQDAKDGDVLCCENGWTCIFKALDNHTNTFSSYCFMDSYKWFCETGSECHTLDKAFIKAYNGEIYPATKEQRDTLERAITNAGYRWDKENLKLEKI